MNYRRFLTLTVFVVFFSVISLVAYAQDNNNGLTHATENILAQGTGWEQIAETDCPDQGYAKGVSWSPDGTKLATAGGKSPVLVCIWETGDWESPTIVKYVGQAVAWSPDGTQLVSAGKASQDKGSSVALVELSGEKEEIGNHHLRGYLPENVTGVDWSPDGQYVLSSSERVIIWDTTSRKPAAAWQSLEGSKRLGFAIWSPDGSMMAASGSGGDLWFGETPPYDGGLIFVEPFKVLQDLGTGDYDPFAAGLNWSPDNIQLAATFHYELTYKTIIWDVQADEEVITLDGTSVAWSPDGTLLAVAGNPTRILDTSTFETVTTIEVETRWVDWSPNENLLSGFGSVADEADGTVRIWRITIADPDSTDTSSE